ncbi:MAG: L,D-transpeptidase family protein [Allosphingosinicella sp.]
MATDDNQHMPFMVVDKANARMFLFAAGGTLVGTTPVLLGLGRGDDSPAGIGDRPLASIPPADRITPAGRFEATMGVNLAGQDILWVDYDAALSVHRASDPKPGLTAQGRLARLASLTVEDNRVSHGCINVPAAFFEQVLRPAFADTIGIVYILPETRPLHELFPQVT